MKNTLIVAIIIAFAGCIDASAGGSASGAAKGSTIERFTSNSSAIQAYTPGDSVIVTYDKVTKQGTTTPADQELIDQFYQIVDDIGAASGSGVNISCSSQDKAQDCFCSVNCCRDAHTCHCC